MSSSLLYTSLNKSDAADAATAATCHTPTTTTTTTTSHLPPQGDLLLYSINQIQTEKLNKYPTYTPRHASHQQQQQHAELDNYNKTRKKISLFKQLTNLTPTFCRVSVTKMSAFNVNAFKLVKLLSTYFLFVFLPVFFVVAMVQAYQCVHKFNLNQVQLHASVRTLNQNYKHFLLNKNNKNLTALDSNLSVAWLASNSHLSMYKDTLLYFDNETELQSGPAAAARASRNENVRQFQSEMNDIRHAINSVYSAMHTPYDFCPFVPESIEGPLNVTRILTGFGLSALVEFHDNNTYNTSSNQYNNNNFKLFTYSNESTAANGSVVVYNEFFWRLWNTHNISLLNASSSEFDHTNGTMPVSMGGAWRPGDCKSRFKLAIIIPFRDRLPHLNVLMHFLHMLLQRQLIEYRIFVVEPVGDVNSSFNKGRVMNAAYLEALKLDKFDCFIFHDVDLLPEDDRNMYTCYNQPRHLSVSIDKFHYTLPYDYLVGGVFAIRTEQYRLVNGYSNSYWGWGGEDDDLAVRIRYAKLTIQRPPARIARYKMMRHKQQKLNDNRHKQLTKARLLRNKDGLNSVSYKIVQFKLFTSFTYILVDVGSK